MDIMSGEETEYGESSKKKTKKRKHDALNEHTSPKLHIKTEPDTELSTHKIKSKKSKHNHKFSMKLEKNNSDEESFLNLKVKEEESKFKLLDDCHSIKNESVQSGDSDFKSKLKKSKKKKPNKFSIELSDIEDKAKVKHKKDKWSGSEEIQLSQDELLALQSNGVMSQVECQSTEDSFSKVNHHRKKKKHSKKPRGDNKLLNNMEIEDHFSAEETVINTPKKREESFKNKKLSEQIVFEDEDIINSQPLAESEDEPHAAKNHSTSKDEAHTADRQPLSESHEEPHSPSSDSMSENENEPRATQSQPSPIKDKCGVEELLAAYVSSLSSCSVVAPAVQASVEAGSEAWLVVVPRSLAPASIRHVELASSLASCCKLKADSARYVGTLAHDIPSLAVLAPHGRVQCLRLQGSIRFHKKLPKPTAAHDLLPDDWQTAFIPLPPTKTRHPLFGADYRASINIPDSVTEQLEDALRVKKTSKRANKVNTNKTTGVEFNDEVIHVKEEKSKKKGKRKLSAETSATMAESSQPKRKKKKQLIENGDVWHSERHMEETLFQF